MQAVVCWASAKSVALYGQLTPEQMADASDIVNTTDASRFAHVQPPHVCPETVLDELQKCVEHIETSNETTKGKSAKAAHVQGTLHTHTAPEAKKRRRRAPTPKPAPSALPPKTPPRASSPTAEEAVTPAPPATPKTTIYGVGPPLNTVTVRAPHPLDNENVSVLNSAWGVGK